jgi:hypothetical protein
MSGKQDAKGGDHANQERRKAAAESGKLASAKRNQPHEVREQSLMKRQQKGLHNQDGK